MPRGWRVLSPEHPFVNKWQPLLENWDEVSDYVAEAGRKSDFERAELNKEKTGVELKGVKAVNPVTGWEIPIFISDYVLVTYGTGAIMAVPAHDQRDWEFAKKFGCEIVEVVKGGGDIEKEAFTLKDDPPCVPGDPQCAGLGHHARAQGPLLQRGHGDEPARAVPGRRAHLPARDRHVPQLRGMVPL